jgi:hypothetical protein
MIDAIRLDRCKRIKTIIVACRTVGDVKRRARVVETIWIDDTVVYGSCSLVEMRMPINI